MTPATDAADAATLAVLMALRIRGRADVAVLMRVTRLADAVVRAVVDAAVGRGSVRPMRDAAGPRATDAAAALDDVLTVTPAGDGELHDHLAAESIDRVALAARYDAFLTADARLKTAIAAWQIARPSSGEASAVREMRTLDAASTDAARLIDELAIVAPRLRAYAARFTDARRAVARGDAAAVASPRVDSLHQVWFELHEDLLLTLGRARGA